jgi:hypothetical protein
MPTCGDAVLSGDETDVDCGGTCGPCLFGGICAEGSDCPNDRCVDFVCAKTCDDLLLNNGETDVDCGGAKCSSCGTGRVCEAASDCSSSRCLEGVCG